MEIWNKIKELGITAADFYAATAVLEFLKANNASIEEVVEFTKRARKITATAIPADIAEKLINTLNGTCDCPGCTAARADKKTAEQEAQAKVN